jgi:signal peptidase II
VAGGLTAAVVAIDVVTKRIASLQFSDGPLVVIPDFLVLTYTENPGAAFSLLQDGGAYLGAAAIAVSLALLWTLRKAHHPLETVAFGLIIGGALGNLVDRVFRGPGLLDGKVIDWIDLWWIPTFNVADMSITIAVGLLLIHAWLTR